MSCGCGGRGSIPVSVTLRMEAVRMALQASTDRPVDLIEKASKVFDFITTGQNLAELDTPPQPVATGTDQEAVTSRNALLFKPLTQIHGLKQGFSLKVLRGKLGCTTLGELVQVEERRLAGLSGQSHLPALRQLHEDLAAYGLRLGMSTDDLRQWVLEGPR